MINSKSLNQTVIETENSLKALQSKLQVQKRMKQHFADAYEDVLDNSAGGTRAYFSASIGPEVDKARPVIYYSPPAAGHINGGRFMLRFCVSVGKEKIYSATACTLPSASVADMLNKYISMPSGSAAIAEVIPKPVAKPKVI